MQETSDGKSVSLYRADPFSAEHLRWLLWAFDISAAVILGDRARFGQGIAEVLVMSADHARAAKLLAKADEAASADEWVCPHCSEPVPGNFDLCWNCGETHQEPAPASSDATQFDSVFADY